LARFGIDFAIAGLSKSDSHHDEHAERSTISSKIPITDMFMLDLEPRPVRFALTEPTKPAV
jgi:hypothetical protein